jgi:hypothetical protein
MRYTRPGVAGRFEGSHILVAAAGIPHLYNIIIKDIYLAAKTYVQKYADRLGYIVT